MGDLKVNEIKTDAIKNAAGTSSITIDSEGFYVPKVRTLIIHKSGHQSLTSSTWTTVTGWNADFEQGLTWDSSNNRINITAAQAGTYEIHYSLAAYSSSNNIGDMRATVALNGTKNFGGYNMIVHGSTGSDPFDVRHFMVQSQGYLTLAENDQLSFQAYIAATGPLVYAGDGEGSRSTNVIMRQIG